CLAGTRVQVLDSLTEILHLDSESRLLWLTGVAGSGKSTIANSMAERFYNLQRLGASFRFVRQHPPESIFRQIAYQLTQFDETLKCKILDALKKHWNVASQSLTHQVQKILIEPLSAIELSGPILIIIDALDE
ncbi:hypothetical protein JAAARDRAFT_113786, partial [Jaapia argillacea MUCL 33604]